MKWITIYEADSVDAIDEFCEDNYLYFEGTDELRSIGGLIIHDGDDIEDALKKVRKLIT